MMFSHNGDLSPVLEVEIPEENLIENEDAPSLVSQIFQQAEQELSEPEEDSVKETESLPNVNAAFEAWQDANESDKSDLLETVLASVTKYVRGIALQLGAHNNADDIAQQATIKVWKNLSDFDGKHFSTWVYKIAKNTLLDTARHDQREEKKLKKAHDTDQGGRQIRTGPSGYGPDGNENDEEVILPDWTVQANAKGLNIQIDFEKVFSKLTKRDQKIVEMYCSGCEPIEIGEKFGRDAKWASNQLVRLKDLLKNDLCINGVTFHSCRLPVLGTTEVQAGQFYVEYNGLYRRLSMCRCRKTLTEHEAYELVGHGEAHPLYKVENGETVVCPREIWAPQAVRVPRCGLNNSRSHLEKAYGIGNGGNHQIAQDIEIGHEITIRERQKLIRYIPALDYDRQEREDYGRVVFTTFKEQGN